MQSREGLSPWGIVLLALLGLGLGVLCGGMLADITFDMVDYDAEE
jgi:hypothetical protein